MAKLVFPLFDRVRAWVDVFSRREDVEIEKPLDLRVEPRFEVYGELPYVGEAKEFAERAKYFSFGWARGEIQGALHLSLEAATEWLRFELDGAALPESDCIALDLDEDATGHTTFYIPRKKPLIVFSASEQVRFESFGDYLTRGAKRAFERGWQRGGPGSLPRARVEGDGLVKELAKRTDPKMAAELVRWLGDDAALLLTP